MKIVQIIGPAYCGSTALGYSLNTCKGFFFGSEVSRVLKSMRNKFTQGRFPSCDLCGRNCSYWSENFFENIKDTDSLSDVYEVFGSHYKECEYFVDASKDEKVFLGTNAYARIIAMKHPVRMLASRLYNNRNQYDIPHDEYSYFSNHLSDNNIHVTGMARKYFSWLINRYQSMFKFSPEAFVFKADLAHCDDFRIFRELEDYLGVGKDSFTPKEFGSFSCHSIGGNRAPVWIAKEKRGDHFKKNDRFYFYKNADSLGDWKIDDKYKELIPEDVLSEIFNVKEYDKLCRVMGYGKQP